MTEYKTPEQVVAEALEADRRRPKSDWADWAGPVVAALREAGMLVEEPEWEYAQGFIENRAGDWYVGKSFGADKDRELDEGYVMVRRSLGPWVEVPSE